MRRNMEEDLLCDMFDAMIAAGQKEKAKVF
jgi:hypothetical protein